MTRLARATLTWLLRRHEGSGTGPELAGRVSGGSGSGNFSSLSANPVGGSGCGLGIRGGLGADIQLGRPLRPDNFLGW